MRLRWMFSCLAWLALSAYAAEPVSRLANHPAIKLVLDGKPADLLDQAALASMPRASVKAAAPGEQPSTWQGVALEDIVGRTCVASGDALVGRALSRFVRVTAADGQQVVFSAAELHPDFGHAQVILADSRDGKPLAQDAPFRLIVPGDKRADRWLSFVTTVEVVDASTP
ncbi:molybdopterin-dependent oxidoreductase [Dyella halodurans]|uniref:Molybdopterin-dependent oxidoreductase n=1 Tax=Dyella halodurans TaxID=1920171 RepID=A0ABV9C433_9GAMM|nr:molybdopterin-dependent oxidoreductase [Dyella halodurans]